MTEGRHRHWLRACAAIAAVLALLLAAAQPVRAADPTFPTGSRIGMVPPAGMSPSKRFSGFEDPANNSAILVTGLPAAAYSELEKTIVPEALKRQGIDADKREPMDLGIGKGFLIVGNQDVGNAHYRKWILIAAASDLTVLVSAEVPQDTKAYSDAAIRAAFATLATRANVPDAERLSLLPFTVGDLAGFHVEDVLPGRALMLADTPATDESGKDKSGKDESAAAAPKFNARMLVAAVPGGPGENDDRGNFARVAFDGIGGVKDVRITMSEPLRLAGQQGYQTMAQAKDVHAGGDVMVVQWLRFGTGGFMQMVGMADADGWVDTLARLRKVRDSVNSR